MHPAVEELIGIMSGLLPSINLPYHLHEPTLDKTDEDAVVSCIREKYVSSVGSWVNKFESELAHIFQARHAVCVFNGTVALHGLLHTLGIGRDDEVLCPALTFVGTANAISHSGATPHFVDCNAETLGVDADALRLYLNSIAIYRNGKLINKNTQRRIAALVVVHVLGHAADVDALQTVTDEYGLLLIEDAAEALGTLYKGKPVGARGKAGMVSFNGNKVITTGSGGALLTNDDHLAQHFRYVTSTAKLTHPWGFYHTEVGFNYRMPSLNAALGLSQLKKLPYLLEKKRNLAAIYAQAFNHSDYWGFIAEPSFSTSNYWLNAIKLKTPMREIVESGLEQLSQQQFYCRPLWTAMHHLPMYIHCPRGPLPITESLEQQVINLPSSPNLLNVIIKANEHYACH